MTNPSGGTPIVAQASDRRKRIFISTGEVSGDLQAALLTTALQQEARERGLTLEIVGLGGIVWLLLELP